MSCPGCTTTITTELRCRTTRGYPMVCNNRIEQDHHRIKQQ